VWRDVCLETPLVHRSGARGPVRQVPPASMRVGQPTQVIRQIAILPWPQDQVPVVRHQTKNQQPHSLASSGLLQHLFKGSIVSRLLEHRASANASVEHMIDKSAGCHSRSSWHPINLPGFDPLCNRNETRPNPVRLDCCRGVGRWQAVYWRRRAGGQKSVARRNTVRGAGHFGAAANAVAVARTGDRALGVGVLFL
jgi:hypothetical protein